VVATLPQPDTFKFVFKKSASEWRWRSSRFRWNGKILRGPISGKDANGVWKYYYVFDRQQVLETKSKLL